MKVAAGRPLLVGGKGLTVTPSPTSADPQLRVDLDIGDAVDREGMSWAVAEQPWRPCILLRKLHPPASCQPNDCFQNLSPPTTPEAPNLPPFRSAPMRQSRRTIPTRSNHNPAVFCPSPTTRAIRCPRACPFTSPITWTWWTSSDGAPRLIQANPLRIPSIDSGRRRIEAAPT